MRGLKKSKENVEKKLKKRGYCYMVMESLAQPQLEVMWKVDSAFGELYDIAKKTFGRLLKVPPGFLGLPVIK